MKAADPSPAAEIEVKEAVLDSRCGGRCHGVGFLELMQVKVTCNDSEAVLALAPSLEA